MLFDPVTWRDVLLTGAGHVLTIRVASDYLAVDGVRRPLSAGDAQTAVDALGAMLPTPAIVDAIWLAADVRLEPISTQPWDASMMSPERWIEHDRLIDAQLAGRTGLIAGHKKDVVVSNRLLEHPEARGPLIFGWHRANGVPIQPLSAAHRMDGPYLDYSHACRPIRLDCLVDGAARDLRDVLRDPALASLVSSEGPLRVLRYEANSSAPPNTSPAPALPVLRRGDRGEAVRAWQATLSRLGWTLTTDGQFGPTTETRTKAFQRAAGLTADGVVGIRTRAAAATFGGEVPGVVATSPGEDWPAVAPYQPLSDAERVRIFGAFDFVPAPATGNPEGIRILGDWAARNIVSVEIPQLRGIEGAPASCRVSFHRLGAVALRRLWQAWEDEGILGDARSFAGTWAPRFIRGSTSILSNHATGTAMDLNAAWNPLGRPGAAAGRPGDMRRLARVAMDLGWESGHHFGRVDDMHLQLGRGAL